MTKRPLCFLCFLMVLGLGIMNFAGIPLLGGNPLPVTVQDWIEAHPGSVICGEVEQYENTEYSGGYKIYTAQNITSAYSRCLVWAI